MPDTATSPVKAPKYIPAADLIELVNKDLNDRQIAELLGCDRSNITRRRQHLGLTRASLKSYKDNRADVLAIQQARLLDNITPADVAKAGLRDKVVAMGILYDKERLERGQATSIVEHSSIQSDLDAITAKRQALQAKLDKLSEYEQREASTITVMPCDVHDQAMPTTDSTNTNTEQEHD